MFSSRELNDRKFDRQVRLVIVFGIVCLLAGLLITHYFPPTTCREDESCWDCKTMGNKVCGPEVSTTSK